MQDIADRKYLLRKHRLKKLHVTPLRGETSSCRESSGGEYLDS